MSGGPGRGAWQPGETDLEAAALVLQLLQWLVPHHKQHRSGAVQDLWSKAYVCVPSIDPPAVSHQGALMSACLNVHICRAP